MDKKEDKPIKNAGKGDTPRNIFTNKFKNNYEGIDWSIKNKRARAVKKSNKTTYRY